MARLNKYFREKQYRKKLENKSVYNEHYYYRSKTVNPDDPHIECIPGRAYVVYSGDKKPETQCTVMRKYGTPGSSKQQKRLTTKRARSCKEELYNNASYRKLCNLAIE